MHYGYATNACGASPNNIVLIADLTGLGRRISLGLYRNGRSFYWRMIGYGSHNSTSVWRVYHITIMVVMVVRGKHWYNTWHTRYHTGHVSGKLC